MKTHPRLLIVVDGTLSSTAPCRRRNLAISNYILGWLRPTDAIWSFSRPFWYLIVLLRFHLRPASTWPRLGGAVDAGSCHSGSVSGDTLGARSGPRRSRSGVLKDKVIMVPPWDSPATRGWPAGLGGVAGIIILPSLSPGVSFCSIPATLLLCSAWFAAILAALAPVNDRTDTLP